MVTQMSTMETWFLDGSCRPPLHLLRSEMCQQPALPHAWLILSQPQKPRPCLEREPMTNAGPSLKCCVKEASKQDAWPSRDPCIFKRPVLLPLKEGP